MYINCNGGNEESTHMILQEALYIPRSNIIFSYPHLDGCTPLIKGRKAGRVVRKQ